MSSMSMYNIVSTSACIPGLPPSHRLIDTIEHIESLDVKQLAFAFSESSPVSFAPILQQGNR